MGRPLSPSQIHQKNISMLSKLHKTTSEYWQRTSGTQKSKSLSSKTGRKNYKRRKKETKEAGRELHPRKGIPSQEGNPIPGRESHPRKGIPSQEGNLKKRGFQTPGNTLPAESVVSLGSTEGNITGRKNR